MSAKKDFEEQKKKAEDAGKAAAEGSPERAYWNRVVKSLEYAVETTKFDASGASTIDNG
jgi:hypothetical protein